jgi:ATP-dependent exoDNAse (exonuclease V) beta subunit
MSPGRHVCQDDRGQRSEVVWWDPSALTLGVKPVNGVRGGDLLAKDGAQAAVADGREQYAAWRRARTRAVASGKTESQRPRTVRHVAAARAVEGLAPRVPVTWIDRASAQARPYRASGPRFGSLVHAVLASVDFDEAEPSVRRLAAMHARVLGCPAHEADEAVARVHETLGHAIFARIRAAAAAGRCYREWPVVMKADDTAIEGVVDIVFEDERGWTVLDYKTDRDVVVDDRLYEHQVALYAEAASRALGQPVSAAIVRV